MSAGYYAHLSNAMTIIRFLTFPLVLKSSHFLDNLKMSDDIYS